MVGNNGPSRLEVQLGGEGCVCVRSSHVHFLDFDRFKNLVSGGPPCPLKRQARGAGAP